MFGVMVPVQPQTLASSRVLVPERQLAGIVLQSAFVTERPLVDKADAVSPSLVGLVAASLAASTCRQLRRRWRVPRPADSGLSLVFSPEETFGLLVQKAENISKMSTLKILHAAFMGGCYVGMAGLLSLVIAGNLSGPNIIARQVVFAALFPVNLLLVLQTGGQLFTGNTATMSMGICERKVNMGQALRVLFVSYLGNALGCGLLAVVAWYTGMFNGGVAELAVKTTLKKCSYSFGVTVVKAIMCNWLVCMAVWLATSAKDLTSKMVGIWFPISMFIMIGFEHSVANMFMLPAGLISGAPIFWADVIWKNLIPVTIGNAIAGTLIFGAGFSFSFGRLGSGQRGSFRGLFGIQKGKA